MNYRTDLAVEADELLEDAERADETRSGAELSARRAAGYIKKQRQLDEDIAVIEIEILNEEGEKAFQRPRGTYVTIEIQGLFEEKENIRERASRAVAAELKKLIPFDYFLKVLVVGLGNEKVTPDSLGPHTVDKVKITRHLFQMFDCDGDWEMANVSGFNPSVTGVTGMETVDLIGYRRAGGKEYPQSQYDDSDQRQRYRAGRRHGKPPPRDQRDYARLPRDCHRSADGH